MTRLLIIGIDGMDPEVFEQLENVLPNLSMIRSAGIYKRCKSTFPPDSVPAWATIFTGIHPAKHGWLDNVDYEDIRKGKLAFDAKVLEGNTFWDVASQKGNRVCVINPLLAYPVWPVNGVMVSGPVFITGDSQAFPKDILDDYPSLKLGGMTDFPGRNKSDEFIHSSMESAQELAEFGYDLYQKEDWDIFFISFFTMDRVQHFLWRYFDSSDPTFPGDTKLNMAIPNLYRQFDQIVGKFIELAIKDTIVIVLSDHGHGKRPINQLNINELLRKHNILKTPEENRFLQIKKKTEQLKNLSLNWMAQRGIGDLTYTIGRMIPRKARKALKKSSFVIDKFSSSAWASEMGGSTPVGGIEINPEKFKRGSTEYSQLVNQIQRILTEFNVSLERPVIKWISKSEDYMNNEKGYYPDILFELIEDYSVGSSLFTDIFTLNPRHMLISGGHKPQGVLFAYGANCISLPEQPSLLDIFPLILDNLQNEHTLHE
jgi:predicted AlkP superfamily phosphohydrolase/phosphomutase